MYLSMYLSAWYTSDNLAREADPWHIFAGAIEIGSAGWWFSDVGTGPGFLPPSPGVLKQPLLQLGSQPTTQLSLDLPLMENYPNPWTCVQDGCVNSFASGDALWTQGLELGQPVANSAGGIGTTTLYPSPSAFRSVLWLGLIQGGMSHQLAFVYGPYGEAATEAHAAYTSQIGAFARELAELLPAIHRSVASTEPPHPNTSVTGGPSSSAASSASSSVANLGWRSRAWRLGTVVGNHSNLTIHAVVVNLSPGACKFSLAVDAPELLEGEWIATRRHGSAAGSSRSSRWQRTVVPVQHGVLGGEVL
eukprot:SAG11_NODE_7190_length_1181_cov_1.992606_1_plen_304_part_01